MEKDNHNGMKIKMKPTEVDLDQDFAQVNGLDPANSGSRKSGLNNKASYDASDV